LDDDDDDDGTSLCLPLQSVCILLLTAALLNSSSEYNYGRNIEQDIKKAATKQMM
jgi:hypothetical protein